MRAAPEGGGGNCQRDFDSQGGVCVCVCTAPAVGPPLATLQTMQTSISTNMFDLQVVNDWRRTQEPLPKAAEDIRQARV